MTPNDTPGLDQLKLHFTDPIQHGYEPPIHYREIVRILSRKFGYKTNHHTVKSFLEQSPMPVQLELQIETFHEFEDAYEGRWTVVRLYDEGWNKKSIAGV